MCVVLTDPGEDRRGAEGELLGREDAPMLGHQLAPQGDVAAGGDFDMEQAVIPILVIACNRPSINRNLDQLLK